MHSYVDHVQAVRLYLRLRKRIKATTRELGYPRCIRCAESPRVATEMTETST